MIRSLYYLKDNLEKNISIDKVKNILGEKQGTLFFDLKIENKDDFKILEEFGFHPLAIEDCISEEKRAKIEEYDGYFFIVVNCLHPEKNGEFTLSEVDIFVSKNYLLTVHKEEVPIINSIWERCEKNLKILEKGTDLILYYLLDTIVDQFFPAMEEIENKIENIEEKITKKPSSDVLGEIFLLRRALTNLRRVISPHRELFSILISRSIPFVKPTTLVYLRDVYDHIIRIYEMIDVSREMMTVLLETYLSTISNKMSEVIKILTVIGTIFMPLTFLTGIYGMNFRYFPEIEWRYGYILFWTISILIIISMVLFFRKKKWW